MNAALASFCFSDYNCIVITWRVSGSLFCCFHLLPTFLPLCWGIFLALLTAVSVLAVGHFVDSLDARMGFSIIGRSLHSAPFLCCCCGCRKWGWDMTFIFRDSFLRCHFLPSLFLEKLTFCQTPIPEGQEQ